MLQPTKSTNQKLGALRSDITITLHSRMGTLLWNGRDVVRDSNGKITRGGISSMPRVLKGLTQIQRDAEYDDPFADYYLLNFEQTVEKHREEMKQLISELMEKYAADIPEGIDISRCENVTPVTYQILSYSQLGFKLIYLLTDFDVYARTVATAQHIALITRREAMQLTDRGSALIRKCFAIVDTYRHSGVTRQDAVEHNARYKDALARFKLDSLPQDVISGERRAEFAPIIRERSIKTGAVTQSESTVTVVNVDEVATENTSKTEQEEAAFVQATQMVQDL